MVSEVGVAMKINLKNFLTVSSYQMAEIWVPNMIDVKRANRSPSKSRNRMKMMVAGGEKAGQPCHSVLRQPICFLMKNHSSKLNVI